jgi:ATP-dependent RNA helicase RhlE
LIKHTKRLFHQFPKNTQATQTNYLFMQRETRGRKPSTQSSFDDFVLTSDSPSSSDRGGRRSSSYSFRREDRGSESRSGGRSDRGRFGGGSSRGRDFGRRSAGHFGNRRGGVRNREEIKHSRYIKAGIVGEAQKYEPKHKFDDFEIHEALKERIQKRGYETPTPIQDQAIPAIIEGKDVIGLANTGTGKTAAFLIPMIDKVLKARKDARGLPDREIIKGSVSKYKTADGKNKPEFKYFIDEEPKCLIVVPTRELATQIEDELLAFAPDLRIFSAVCVGGTNMQRQIARLNKVCQIVIGTPGRLLDLIERGHLNLSKFQSIVLDEVDRMLDMGFIDDVTTIANLLPEHRHSLFFSATMDPKLKPLMSKLLRDPVTISVVQGQTSDYVDQDIVRVSRGESKLEKLVEILKRDEVEKALIFCQRKVDVDDLEYQLKKEGFKIESIHGDKRQRTRDIAIKRFKAGEVNILIATDVAARGLDIPLVTHVINYDEPENYDDYTHRIGRAGRAGNKGWALTFVR